EFTKNAVTRRPRDARAGVADDEAHTATFDPSNDGHRRTGWRMDGNVFQQVAQRLVEQAGVKAGERQRVRDVEGHGPFAKHRADAVEHRRDDLAEGVPLTVRRDARFE